MKKIYLLLMSVTLLMVMLIPDGFCQEYSLKKISYHVSSGIYKGQIDNNARKLLPTEGKNSNTYRLAYQTIVTYNRTASLRLFFNQSYLGNHSYLTVTSLKDGSQQRLDAESIKTWNYSTGYFNGDALEIKLYVHKDDAYVSFAIDQIMVAETNASLKINDITKSTNAPENTGDLCGTDNRVATTDRAIGRLTNGSNSDCTVYISANGSLLTAGHCRTNAIDAGYNIVEFNIPQSNDNGSVNHPNVRDQYPINIGSIRSEYTENVGNDWCVFLCGQNSNTGLTPAWGQQSFYQLARDFNPTTVRITGCGVDNGRANQTVQTHTGTLNSETVDNANDVYFNYSVDTEPGNSGSPIIWDGTRTVLGIHTNGGCANGGSNKGTSFEADDLENAINQIIGNNTIYVDRSHLASTQSGSIMQPYKSIGTAAANASSGAILSIVTGIYRETVTLTNVNLQAPVGEIVIGPNATARLAALNDGREVEATENANTAEEQVAIATNVFPNPFTQELNIQYTVGSKEKVDLEVYDITGHFIASLVKQELQETGQYQKTFDAGGLPPGIYVYRLRIGEKYVRGKLIKQ